MAITTFHVIKMPEQKLLVWGQLPVSPQLGAQELCSCLSPGLSQESHFFPCSVVSQVLPPAICPSNSAAYEHFTLSSPPGEAEDMMRKAMATTSVPGWKEWKGEVQVHDMTQGLEGTSLPQVMYILVKQVSPKCSSPLLRPHLCQGFSSGLALLRTFPPREPSSGVNCL